MLSGFSINGHRLKPLLAGLPLGLLTWVLIADIVYILSDDKTWYDLAFWAGVAGVFSVVAMALSSLSNYLKPSDSDLNEVVTVQVALNVSVVVLFAVAAGLATDHGALSGSPLTSVVALHAVGVGLLALSCTLGGELVYRHAVAVAPMEAEEGESHGHGRLAWPR